ncbi:hypothetical protein VT84_22310 [Gemmata sp. SH-PL17]|uniref:hypothetical protein n=1 Tax=Gemmata sp. SH-PL17 TaxID=1630693 RepID=UPI00078E349D|nr:hypothetical protein [Gemmata sp. SH-PL17]AMV27152.1 hypothetical protein VT84_22310 [Gemmata sp. SH-PL17]
MSTEQQPPATQPLVKTEPKSETEPNVLAASLANGWEKFKQGQLVSYRVMALTLVIVAAVGVTYYILVSNKKVESSKWVEWDSLGSVASMEEYAKKNPNTPQARLAALEVARIQLGADGIERLPAQDKDVRKKAVESIEKARETFSKLVDEFKDDPLLKTQCLLGAAKAEAVLVGMLKDDSLDQFRGDPKKAIDWLDKVAEAAPDTNWGKDSKKLADELRNLNTKDQIVKLQTTVYSIQAPSLPTLDPKMPGLTGIPGHGGQPIILPQ